MRRPAAVLLIEDDVDVQRTVQSGLARENIQVTATRFAADGLEAASGREFDLIMIDLGLPDMHGFELLRRIKAVPTLSAVPVLLLTAQGNLEDKVQGFELGASDYITKPFDLPELRVRARALLRSKWLQDDLTQTNRDLDAARLAAEAATRAKSEFLAQMSHEIRTPMNGVIGMARLLLESGLNAQQRELVETIQTSGDALLTVINDILDFSKIESGKLDLENHPFELVTCVEDVLDLLAAKADEKRLDLSYEIAESVPAVIAGDSSRLRQILVNLVGNAVKFTAKGEVHLSVTGERLPEDAPSRNPQWQLHFAVRDTGIGIPADRFGALFKSFSQVDSSTTRRFGGTGLGLAISKSLVELMGGKIWVESEVGKGSTFQFTMRAESVAGAATASETREPSALAGMRLLLVDDNPTNRRILRLQCKKWGIQNEAADSGANALEMLRKGATFDAAILDMQMPEMDGIMLARRIRAELPNLGMPLILLTSMGLWADTPREDVALFLSCVNKPVKPSQLFAILAQARGVAGEPAAQTKAPAPPRKEKERLSDRFPLEILLVDDNAINQKVALRLLQQMGYKADVANNGLEAVSAAERKCYDMVLMDVQMPELDGMDATRRIRKLTLARQPIIIAMTANAMRGDREKCIESGMDDYLTKPIQPERLQQTIAEWAEKGRALATAAEAPQSSANAEPVDLKRLEEFTDGSFENLRELVELYLGQTVEQLSDLDKAIASANPDEIRKLAHKTAGSSATCGMDALSVVLRQIEGQAAEQQISCARSLFAEAQAEFRRVQTFLNRHLQSASAGH